MAKSISPAEFRVRFPLKEAERELGDIHQGDMHLHRDSAVTGIVYGNVVIPPNLVAEITGQVHGSVTVEAGAVAYISGVVDGTVRVFGAALITGAIGGGLRASEDAVIAVTRSVDQK